MLVRRNPMKSRVSIARDEGIWLNTVKNPRSDLKGRGSIKIGPKRVPSRETNIDYRRAAAD
jgi:hypothetical protein